MTCLLSVVDAVFGISGRGVVVLPGIPPGRHVNLVVGALLLLKRPDGSEIMSVVKGIEMSAASRDRGILLDLPTKDDAPRGTELWLPSEIQPLANGAVC